MGNRVFITGMGLFTPLGIGVDNNWKSLICRDNVFTPYKIKKSSKEDELYVGAIKCKNQDSKYSTMVKTVLSEALYDKELLYDKRLGRTALIFGSSLGNATYMNKLIKKRESDMNLCEILPEYLAYSLAEEYLIQSQILVMNAACSSSSYAIGKAYQLIKDDIADKAYVVGVDAAVSEMGLTSFSALGVLSQDPYMRPFDVKHNGFILSEGAGALVLQKNPQRAYAEIIGFGSSCDSYHIVAPDPEGKGAVLAMQKALEDAKITPEDIDYINCHGTGTRLNDIAEYEALQKVFSKKVLASSTKAITGHLLGACGIVETIFSCLAINKKIVPGTANLECPIGKGNVILPKDDRKENISIVMNNTFAFGGQNASIILKKV